MLALSDTKIHLKASKIVSSNYHTIAVILHASKVILKFLQAKFQQNMNFQMFRKLDLENTEEPEIKLPTSVGSLKSKRVP